MSKKFWIVFCVILGVIFLGFISYFFLFDNSEKSSSYEAEKTSMSDNSENTLANNISNEENSANLTNEATAPSQEIARESPPTPTEESQEPQESAVPEEQISAFSTKIYSKDSARQHNINITCNALNGTIVKNGSTFSFCSTIGPSTSAKRYKEADIFDANGNKKKGLGGGNCQISTTLYNAILEAPGLKVTERHKHSNYVPYIAKGKDAAVAYGSYDLKFLNSSGYNIKILASASSELVSISLVKLRLNKRKKIGCSRLSLSYFVIINAFGKYLSPIGVDVLFTTFPLLYIVADDPPSKFAALYASYFSNIFCSSNNVAPIL